MSRSVRLAITVAVIVPEADQKVPGQSDAGQRQSEFHRETHQCSSPPYDRLPGGAQNLETPSVTGGQFRQGAFGHADVA